MAVLSLTRIISVATSWKLNLLPNGWPPIQPEPPAATVLLRLSRSFSRTLPWSTASRAAKRIGVLIELAAGRGWSGCSWAKLPSSSTSTKAPTFRSGCRAASWVSWALSWLFSWRASNWPRPLLGTTLVTWRLALLSLGASSFKAVPVITPRAMPRIKSRSSSKSGLLQPPSALGARRWLG